MKRLFVVLLVTGLFVGCGCGARVGGDPERVFLHSYIMGYYDFESLYLMESHYDGQYSISIHNIPLDGARVRSLGDYESTGELEVSYDALCMKHGDVTFNREVTIWDGGGPNHWTYSLGVDFVSVEIVSDADFDEDHPAGESLGDIIMFGANTWKPYIDRGYTGEEIFSFKKLVSELTPEDLTLLGAGGNYIAFLMFDGSRTLAKTHNFTVTMTADDGRVFSDSIEITFE